MRLWKLALSLALLTLPGIASAAAINSQGAAGAPVSVAASTRVLACKSGRAAALICPEAAVRCTYGPAPTACGVASPVPTSTVGFQVPAGSCWDLSAPNASGGASINVIPWVSAEWDCAAVSGSAPVDTFEIP